MSKDLNVNASEWRPKPSTSETSAPAEPQMFCMYDALGNPLYYYYMGEAGPILCNPDGTLMHIPAPTTSNYAPVGDATMDDEDEANLAAIENELEMMDFEGFLSSEGITEDEKNRMCMDLLALQKGGVAMHPETGALTYVDQLAGGDEDDEHGEPIGWVPWDGVSEYVHDGYGIFGELKLEPGKAAPSAGAVVDELRLQPVVVDSYDSWNPNFLAEPVKPAASSATTQRTSANTTAASTSATAVTTITAKDAKPKPAPTLSPAPAPAPASASSYDAMFSGGWLSPVT